MVVRLTAVHALGHIKDDRVVEPLIGALKDSQWDICEDVLRALNKIVDPRCVEPVIEVIKTHERWDIRKMGANMLVKLYHSEKLDPQSKQKILTERDRIITRHDDDFQTVCQGGAHYDSGGIGVDFPL